MRFDGRTALVTGGSRGIGRAIAQRLGAAGAHVVVVGRTSQTVDSAVAVMSAEGISCSGAVGDMTVPADIARVVEGVVADRGRLDIVCNNAATADSAPFLDLTLDQWQRVVTANVTGPFLVAQAAARHMVEQGSGVIVNISSVSGHGADGMANYSAAKSALHSLTRDIAVELAARGVRCVTVTPGWVETELLVDSMPAPLLDTLRHDFRRVPLQRLLKPAEVADVVAFAASDGASGVTGSELVVDGGALATVYINRSLDYS